MYACFFKRVFDIILSLSALIILSPLLFVLTVVGSVKMKGAPFFVQLRPGRISKATGEERIFKLIKFRTMTNERDKEGRLLPDGMRLNKYGRFLRSASLDELPELINILKGDMSIVGPRPLLVRDMVFMTDTQRLRHTVRPGLTGLAQVNGRNNISWEQKFEYDLDYIGRITLREDIKIIFKTAVNVIKRSDTVREGTESDIDLGDKLLFDGRITKEEYDSLQDKARMLCRDNR